MSGVRMFAVDEAWKAPDRWTAVNEQPIVDAAGQPLQPVGVDTTNMPFENFAVENQGKSAFYIVGISIGPQLTLTQSRFRAKLPPPQPGWEPPPPAPGANEFALKRAKKKLPSTGGRYAVPARHWNACDQYMRLHAIYTGSPKAAPTSPMHSFVFHECEDLPYYLPSGDSRWFHMSYPHIAQLVPELLASYRSSEYPQSANQPLFIHVHTTNGVFSMGLELRLPKSFRDQLQLDDSYEPLAHGGPRVVLPPAAKPASGSYSTLLSLLFYFVACFGFVYFLSHSDTVYFNWAIPAYAYLVARSRKTRMPCSGLSLFFGRLRKNWKRWRLQRQADGATKQAQTSANGHTDDDASLVSPTTATKSGGGGKKKGGKKNAKKTHVIVDDPQDSPTHDTASLAESPTNETTTTTTATVELTSPRSNGGGESAADLAAAAAKKKKQQSQLELLSRPITPSTSPKIHTLGFSPTSPPLDSMSTGASPSITRLGALTIKAKDSPSGRKLLPRVFPSALPPSDHAHRATERKTPESAPMTIPQPPVKSVSADPVVTKSTLKALTPAWKPTSRPSPVESPSPSPSPSSPALTPISSSVTSSAATTSASSPVLAPAAAPTLLLGTDEDVWPVQERALTTTSASKKQRAAEAAAAAATADKDTAPRKTASTRGVPSAVTQQRRNTDAAAPANRLQAAQTQVTSSTSDLHPLHRSSSAPFRPSPPQQESRSIFSAAESFAATQQDASHGSSIAQMPTDLSPAALRSYDEYRRGLATTNSSYSNATAQQMHAQQLQVVAQVQQQQLMLLQQQQQLYQLQQQQQQQHQFGQHQPYNSHHQSQHGLAAVFQQQQQQQQHPPLHHQVHMPGQQASHHAHSLSDPSLSFSSADDGLLDLISHIPSLLEHEDHDALDAYSTAQPFQLPQATHTHFQQQPTRREPHPMDGGDASLLLHTGPTSSLFSSLGFRSALTPSHLLAHSKGASIVNATSSAPPPPLVTSGSTSTSTASASDLAPSTAQHEYSFFSRSMDVYDKEEEAEDLALLQLEFNNSSLPSSGRSILNANALPHSPQIGSSSPQYDALLGQSYPAGLGLFTTPPLPSFLTRGTSEEDRHGH